MKKQFYSIAKKYGCVITGYETYRSKGMGGLQVFDVKVAGNSKVLSFCDSYFHLSGDAPKVIAQFEYEVKKIMQ